MLEILCTKCVVYFAGPHIDVSLPPRSMDDSTVTTAMFNKSTSNYLTVLKKNYML